MQTYVCPTFCLLLSLVNRVLHSLGCTLMYFALGAARRATPPNAAPERTPRPAARDAAPQRATPPTPTCDSSDPLYCIMLSALYCTVLCCTLLGCTGSWCAFADTSRFPRSLWLRRTPVTLLIHFCRAL